MSDDKVVYLKFNNPNAPPGDAVIHLACSRCKNKTFMLIEDSHTWRLVRCCVCGADIGRFGWAPE